MVVRGLVCFHTHEIFLKKRDLVTWLQSQGVNLESETTKEPCRTKGRLSVGRICMFSIICLMRLPFLAHSAQGDYVVSAIFAANSSCDAAGTGLTSRSGAV